MVRAKFRCMSITQEIENWTVRLLPVIAKTEYYPGGSEENKKFWSATPTGEMKLLFRAQDIAGFGGNDITRFVVGDRYYLDLSLAANEKEEPWNLRTISQSDSRLEVVFQLNYDTRVQAPRWGELTMGIDNELAWPHFLPYISTIWKLTLAKATQGPGATYP